MKDALDIFEDGRLVRLLMVVAYGVFGLRLRAYSKGGPYVPVPSHRCHDNKTKTPIQTQKRVFKFPIPIPLGNLPHIHLHHTTPPHHSTPRSLPKISSRTFFRSSYSSTVTLN
ncbi:hypothetical protein IQ07DRAFT_428486 [Pyrenochaeta sp. DS3sAY3a]|nr:hypothetical protein IQ07DRAFT_428486 [Pyrenochaeta sp. DS3sAY3a]